MNWNKLDNIAQLDALVAESQNQPVAIFKHSTRCSISATALNRLERDWTEGEVKPYYLDLLTYREISNAIADRFGIEHQSPQLLLLDKGRVVWHRNHMDISFRDLASQVA